MQDRLSIEVLKECISLQETKGSDYQNKASTVKQADYYPRGVESIYDMMNTKMLRIRSILDKIQSGSEINHESLKDTAKDLINYASFFAAYLDRGIDGQKPDHDMFNKPWTNEANPPADIDIFQYPSEEIHLTSSKIEDIVFNPYIIDKINEVVKEKVEEILEEKKWTNDPEPR